MNRMKTCFASVISEIQQSDIYLTVKARLFETPGANLNGVRVTPAFLAEIVDHQEKYVGLPLCADVKNLANGDYQHLGHLYDAEKGEFHSAQIGSFYRYEREETNDGAALIGYARIMKRNKAVCRAISELFADGKLKFSFEISCGSYRELEDGTIEIDAAEDNFLEGAAVVTFPACESAVALDLVAECNSIADDRREGEQEMTNTNETEVVAEAAIEESAVELASAEELAAKVVVEDHVTVDNVKVVDTETGNVMEDHNVHETHTETVVQEPEIPLVPVDNSVAVVEFADNGINSETAACSDEEKKECAEEAEGPMAENASENEVASTEIAEDNDCDSEEHTDEVASTTMDATTVNISVASVDSEEEKQDQLSQLIAELRSSLQSIRVELAELKDKLNEQPVTVIAEAASEKSNQPNPFMADIQNDENKPSGHKYSLLETEESISSYTLV